MSLVNTKVSRDTNIAKKQYIQNKDQQHWYRKYSPRKTISINLKWSAKLQKSFEQPF